MGKSSGLVTHMTGFDSRIRTHRVLRNGGAPGSGPGGRRFDSSHLDKGVMMLMPDVDAENNVIAEPGRGAEVCNFAPVLADFPSSGVLAQ